MRSVKKVSAEIPKRRVLLFEKCFWKRNKNKQHGTVIEAPPSQLDLISLSNICSESHNPGSVIERRRRKV